MDPPRMAFGGIFLMRKFVTPSFEDAPNWVGDNHRAFVDIELLTRPGSDPYETES